MQNYAKKSHKKSSINTKSNKKNHKEPQKVPNSHTKSDKVPQNTIYRSQKNTKTTKKHNTSQKAILMSGKKT